MGSKGLNLKINQRIEITEDNIGYKSIIQDIEGELVLISAPIAEGKYYPLHIGKMIEFFAPTGNDIIKYRAVVINKRIEKNIHLYALSKLQAIERVQRRAYYRLSVILDVWYYLLPEDSVYTNIDDVPEGYFNRLSKTLSVDISGGGLKIVTKENIQLGRFVIVTLDIPQRINLLCSVVRCDNNIDNINYKTSLRFVNIDERTRDKIISFVFTKMREQSKILK